MTEEERLEQEKLSYAFTIVPAKVDLPKKSGISFQFRGCSTKRGEIKEYFELMYTIGDDKAKPILLKECCITGNFINPALSFNPPKLRFEYKW